MLFNQNVEEIEIGKTKVNSNEKWVSNKKWISCIYIQKRIVTWQEAAEAGCGYWKTQ